MNFTLRLTLDGLVGTLRMKAHSLGDGIESGRRSRPILPLEAEPKPDLKAKSETEGEPNDLARG